jgi:hypothetical protein
MLRSTAVAMLALVAGCEQKHSEQELQVRIALLEAENSRLRQAADRADSARAEYNSCLANASAAYEGRWDISCARLRKEAFRRKAECEAVNGKNDLSCDSVEIPSARECALPNDLAKDYDLGLRHDEQLCLGQFKIEH